MVINARFACQFILLKSRFRWYHAAEGSGLPAQMDTDAHSQQRALLNPAFRSNYVAALLPVFAKCSLDLAGVLQLQCQQNEAAEVQVIAHP